MSTDKVILDRIEKLEKLVDGLGEAYNNLSRVIYTSIDDMPIDNVNLDTLVSHDVIFNRIKNLMIWLNENKDIQFSNENFSTLLFNLITNLDFNIDTTIEKLKNG